ncbi:hypothetical protein WR164_13770 [Philodulcilactobacillus myokoensis]|uniref:Uncharacterized protein n=1 Tax=Philodulcilactobacillus myokoensis TaxID=2929573 RepID=A0A9W6B378_9LACO|nr:hypothetical protein [Philodulcilactobacillus myokoensis]GLB47398.1 hypothetical protein WR164_13770 [Philodulcilactobacillus myokoensis]
MDKNVLPYMMTDDPYFNKIDDVKSIMNETWISRISRYQLTYWYFYDHHLQELNLRFKTQAKSLYYRLSYLSKDELKILADSYYYKTNEERPTLTQLSKKYGMTYNDFMYKRIAIIGKLSKPRLKPKGVGKPTKEQAEREREFKKLYQLSRRLLSPDS